MNVFPKDEVLSVLREKMKKKENQDLALHKKGCHCSKISSYTESRELVLEINHDDFRSLKNQIVSICEEENWDTDYIFKSIWSKSCILEEYSKNGFILFSGDLDKMHKALDSFKTILSERETSIIEKDIATKVCILSTKAFKEPEPRFEESRSARDPSDDGNLYDDEALYNEACDEVLYDEALRDELLYDKPLCDEAFYDLKHINKMNSDEMEELELDFQLFGCLSQLCEFNEEHHPGEKQYHVCFITKDNEIKIPGGSRQILESSVECAVRECFEKIGIKFEVEDGKPKSVDVGGTVFSYSGSIYPRSTKVFIMQANTERKLRESDSEEPC
eukprot:TRINITY_DN1271_c0_g1_i1.p1 TRINITY_DN1271_c0_g1~~TRINITY_DN1271_c0_g1_i1.p1  ORF type:complete len:332 (+),score=75.34 TRINITY_DN1271_c0_g1_i1:47-1042(+)